MRWPEGPRYLTVLPGAGNRMSYISSVKQPLMLATNKGGNSEERFSNATDSDLFFEELLSVIVMGAQFMYISRLPIRLNQVQAMVYSPASMLSGIVKLGENGVTIVALVPTLESLSVSSIHPPSIDIITLHVVELLGARSEVILIWQEPPPWVVPPWKVMDWVSPFTM
jgi:hypothetical protein